MAWTQGLAQQNMRNEAICKAGVSASRYICKHQYLQCERALGCPKTAYIGIPVGKKKMLARYMNILGFNSGLGVYLGGSNHTANCQVAPAGHAAHPRLQWMRAWLSLVESNCKVYKVYTHRLHSSSFLGLPYRILNVNHKKRTTMEPMGIEALMPREVGVRVFGFTAQKNSRSVVRYPTRNPET